MIRFPSEGPPSGGIPSELEGRVQLAALRSLEMDGSYPLDDAAIDAVLTRRSPGNFALGYMDGETFVVFYVGRSDSDVRGTLHDWVGTPSRATSFGASGSAPWQLHHRDSFPVDAPAAGPVGTSNTPYTRFAFSYAPSSEAAFEKECRNYDDFGGSFTLDNASRPTL